MEQTFKRFLHINLQSKFEEIKSQILNEDGQYFKTIVFVKETGKIYNRGQVYGGGSDEYFSSMEDLEVPNGVGGIQGGTKVEDLSGKSVSEILDMILFPEVNPTIVAPSASTKFKSGSGFSNGGTYEVGTVLPQTTDLSYTFSAGSITCPGKTTLSRTGEVSEVTYDGPFDSSSEVGTYTYKATVSYGEGPVAQTSYGEVATEDINGQAFTNPLPGGSLTASAVTIYLKHKAYLGTSPKTEGFTSEDLLGFEKKQLASSNSWGSQSNKLSVDAQEGKYIYYAAPSSWGTPGWSDGAGTYSFDLQEEIEFTNESGYQSTFSIWRASKTPGLGTQLMYIY